jgi:hypothetical protein
MKFHIFHFIPEEININETEMNWNGKKKPGQEFPVLFNFQSSRSTSIVSELWISEIIPFQTSKVKNSMDKLNKKMKSL